VLLACAAALDALLQAGEISPDAAIEELIALIGPFLPDRCPTCGDPPCLHDDAWCTSVREGQERRAAERAQPKEERPTPRTTIEAVMWAVRTEGLAALDRADTLERLSRCDARALEEINERIANLLQARTAA
jgi:hypothetical protein